MVLSEKFIKANDSMCDFNNHVNAPYLRKEFELEFIPNKAEITICGLGFYELYINGKDITKGPLAPYISNTDDICYFDNYDISDKLKKGKNVIGILLGNGFRNPFGGFVWDFEKSKHRGPVITSFAVEIENDGEKIIIEADETVKTHSSPITFDDIRMGVRYDAILEINGWNEIGFDASSWENAKSAQKPSGEYKLCNAEPITVTKKLKPVSVTFYESLPFAYKDTSQIAEPIEKTVRPNVYVFDFGVNTAGVSVLKIKGKPGQKITIHHGEHLIRDCFAVNTTLFNREECLEKYLEYGQTDEYICKGTEEIFVPKFKYDGFRYAYVEGLEKEQVNDETLTYYVMNSDLVKRAEFKCSDESLNKLQQCANVSDLANFYYFPTDCPHREKNGWTGDASVSAEHMLLTLKASKSLKEWLCNIRKAQKEDGSLPGIVPTGGWGFEWGNGPAWDAVCVNLPYFIYRFDGDKSVIFENMNMILRYFMYIFGKRNEDGLIEIGLGDWIDPYEAQKGYISAPLAVTDTLQIIDIAQKATHLFKEINNKYACEFAQKIATELRNSFREKLVDFDTMTVSGNCQTSQAMAIAIGVFDEEETQSAFNKLLEIIHNDGDENHCGMLGLRYIYHVLTEHNEYNLAYKMMMSKKRTGYGYMLENNGSSLLETMEDYNLGSSSRNHHFLGDFSSLTIQEFAGLKPNPNADDISYFEISPKFVDELNFAEASYESEYGKISVRWERESDNITMTVTAPSQIHGKIKAPKSYTVDGVESKPIECGKNKYQFKTK